MSITGEPEADGGRSVKVGVAISDIVTGLYATIGILAALIARTDADGQRVDTSLLGSTLAILVNQAQNAFVTGRAPGRLGNAHPNIVPYEAFTTADGDLVVAVGSERQWSRFCEALGLAELATDPRFAANGDRVANRTELRPILAERLASRPTAEWAKALTAAEVPFGEIADVAAAFRSPEAVELGMSEEVEHPALGVLRQAGIPLQFGSTPGSIRLAPPLLGEHTDEVLEALGYRPHEIHALRTNGVV
jgi:crotonobetainyl-CoA:carnitine CoA-transferase CaiB-like acyl-CoA transferase